MWQVEHQCTQCGADVVLEEAQRLFQCPFCRVKLYMSPGDFFRYYIEPGPGSGELIFIPYWRFKGMAFSFAGGEVTAGLVDVSRNATRFDFLPSSLGLRSQTQNLRFLSPAVSGSFLARDINLEDTLALEDRFTAAGTALPQVTYIGESLSCIYAPIYLRGSSVYDGLAGESIAALPGESEQGFPGRQQADEVRLFFMPCICPQCGADMDGEAQSMILTCANCLSAWSGSANEFQKVPCSFVPAGASPHVYLPFWQMEAEAALLESHADAIRVLRLPAAVMSRWENEPFIARVPAFKISPEWFLKIAMVMSFTPGDFSQDEMEEGCPDGELFPAALPMSEAYESLKMVLAYSSPARKGLAELLDSLEFDLKAARLVWWPFLSSGMELVRPDRKFSINAAALKWGKGI